MQSLLIINPESSNLNCSLNNSELDSLPILTNNPSISKKETCKSYFKRFTPINLNSSPINLKSN